MPPLWLPDGSIRGILAIMVIGAACYLGLWYAIMMAIPASENPIIDWLLNTSSLVMGFYFGVKTAQALERARNGGQ